MTLLSKPSIDVLRADELEHILSFINVIERVKLMRVSRFWQTVVKEMCQFDAGIAFTSSEYYPNQCGSSSGGQLNHVVPKTHMLPVSSWNYIALTMDRRFRFKHLFPNLRVIRLLTCECDMKCVSCDTSAVIDLILLYWDQLQCFQTSCLLDWDRLMVYCMPMLTCLSVEIPDYGSSGPGELLQNIFPALTAFRSYHWIDGMTHMIPFKQLKRLDTGLRDIRLIVNPAVGSESVLMNLTHIRLFCVFGSWFNEDGDQIDDASVKSITLPQLRCLIIENSDPIVKHEAQFARLLANKWISAPKLKHLALDSPGQKFVWNQVEQIVKQFPQLLSFYLNLLINRKKFAAIIARHLKGLKMMFAVPQVANYVKSRPRFNHLIIHRTVTGIEYRTESYLKEVNKLDIIYK